MSQRPQRAAGESERDCPDPDDCSDQESEQTEPWADVSAERRPSQRSVDLPSPAASERDR